MEKGRYFMGRTCTSSCPYYGVDENYNGYCKKDHNAYRERYAKCTFESDSSEGSSSSSSSSGSSSSSSGGCYVATAVYHSYDCPQVWILRRFRDDTLAASWYGRAFVRLYYAISPTLVRWFGKTEWFQKLWRGPLDRMVAKLQAKGVKSTPYEDKTW